METGAPPDLELAGRAVAFFRGYADRCHHGKEEDILFRDLKKINLPPELARIMAELEEEHRQGRAMVGALEDARERLSQGSQEARPDFLAALKNLAGFYPGHILKEDKRFFFPCMEYFDAAAKVAMLEEFRRFDQELVHELFGQEVRRWEQAKGLTARSG